MASVHVTWVHGGEVNSLFNPTVTVQGAFIITLDVLSVLQVEVGRSLRYKFSIQTWISSPTFDPNIFQEGLLARLVHMLHQRNTYVQSFLSLREWMHADTPSPEYRIVFHADKRPSTEHVRRTKGSSFSEVDALIPGNEDGMVDNRNIVLRRRGSLNANGNEALAKVDVIHISHDRLSYVILLPDGRDGWHL